MVKKNRLMLEYLKLVVPGFAGGMVVAVITNARTEEILWDAKYFINLVSIGVFLLMGFILFSIINQYQNMKNKKWQI